MVYKVAERLRRPFPISERNQDLLKSAIPEKINRRGALPSEEGRP